MFYTLILLACSAVPPQAPLPPQAPPIIEKSIPKHGDVKDGWTYHRDGYWWRYATPMEASPVLSLPTYSGPVWGPAVGVGGGSCSS